MDHCTILDHSTHGPLDQHGQPKGLFPSSVAQQLHGQLYIQLPRPVPASGGVLCKLFDQFMELAISEHTNKCIKNILVVAKAERAQGNCNGETMLGQNIKTGDYYINIQNQVQNIYRDDLNADTLTSCNSITQGQAIRPMLSVTPTVYNLFMCLSKCLLNVVIISAFITSPGSMFRYQPLSV